MMDAMIEERAADRAEIAAAIKRFLKAGGKIDSQPIIIRSRAKGTDWGKRKPAHGGLSWLGLVVVVVAGAGAGAAAVA